MTRSDLRYLAALCGLVVFASTAIGVGAFIMYEQVTTALTAGIGTALEAGTVVAVGMSLHVRTEKRRAAKRAEAVGPPVVDTTPAGPWQPEGWDLTYTPHPPGTPPS